MWRLINSDYNSGAMNMAIDQALMELSPKPVLRFYRWKPKCMTIGYFQEIHKEINTEECNRRNIDIVRRITGGKAVLHDKELCYSFIASEKDNIVPKDIVASYKIVSKAIMKTLQHFKLKPKMKTEDVNKKNPSAICFFDPSWYEITINGKKIVGSAQTRKNSKILQHGPILIDFDLEENAACFKTNSKNQLKQAISQRVTSLIELGIKTNYEEIAKIMKGSFEKNFSIKLENSKLTKEENNLAEKLYQEKYSKDNWNLIR